MTQLESTTISLCFSQHTPLLLNLSLNSSKKKKMIALKIIYGGLLHINCDILVHFDIFENNFYCFGSIIIWSLV